MCVCVCVCVCVQGEIMSVRKREEGRAQSVRPALSPHTTPMGTHGHGTARMDGLAACLTHQTHSITLRLVHLGVDGMLPLRFPP